VTISVHRKMVARWNKQHYYLLCYRSAADNNYVNRCSSTL